jgi:RNA-directed DNA polymerase
VLRGDADIQSFFDEVNHEWLIRFLEHRIGDRRIIRLIRKWLQAGVMENQDRRIGQTSLPRSSAPAAPWLRFQVSQ